MVRVGEEVLRFHKEAHHINKDIDDKEKNLEGDRAPPLPPPNKALVVYVYTV